MSIVMLIVDYLANLFIADYYPIIVPFLWQENLEAFFIVMYCFFRFLFDG